MRFSRQYSLLRLYVLGISYQGMPAQKLYLTIRRKHLYFYCQIAKLTLSGFRKKRVIA